MTYEVKTPLLLESIEAARAVIRDVQTGAMDVSVATRVLSGARVLQAAISTDIKARTAAPKIALREAKLIEQTADREALENRPAAD